MKRRIARRRLNPQLLTEAQIDYLATGIPLDGPEMHRCADGLWRPFDSEEEARKAYGAHRDEVFEYLANDEGYGPGELPWAEEQWG